MHRYIYTHPCIHTYIDTYTTTRTRTHTQAHTHIAAQSVHTYMHTRAQTHTRTHTHTHTSTRALTCAQCPYTLTKSNAIGLFWGKLWNIQTGEGINFASESKAGFLSYLHPALTPPAPPLTKLHLIASL